MYKCTNAFFSAISWSYKRYFLCACFPPALRLSLFQCHSYREGTHHPDSWLRGAKHIFKLWVCSIVQANLLQPQGGCPDHYSVPLVLLRLGGERSVETTALFCANLNALGCFSEENYLAGIFPVHPLLSYICVYLRNKSQQNDKCFGEL